MRALTANEQAILKSRFQAGADGHRQQVLLTATTGATAQFSRQDFPWVQQLSSYQAGLLFYGVAGGVGGVWFVRYISQHALEYATRLFAYSTSAFGLVRYRGLLMAICWKPSDGSVVYRTSSDGAGLLWSDEATLLPASSYAAAEVGWGGNHIDSPSFQPATTQDGLTLLLFTKAAASNVLNYAATSDADPTAGWSAVATTGLTIPSFKRNYGGSSARNQGTQRVFIACESKTAGTWVVACESDDGDWHANHMATRGTLGGTWTRTLNAGYGGGLSGSQGANGGVFWDRSGDLLFYVMSDNGDSLTAYRSTDSGATWTSLGEQMPSGLPNGLGIGGGCGFAIDTYDFVEYLWGRHWDSGLLGVSGLKAAGSASEANFSKLGAGSYGTFTTTSVDVSDRVIAISTQKDDEASAAGFSVELRNDDLALSINDDTKTLHVYARANVQVEISQWHGTVANKVRTFFGITDRAEEDAGRGTVVLSGRDRAKKLIEQDVLPVAPQTLDQPGYVRDMANFVYLNKTPSEVYADLLAHAGLVPAASSSFLPSTFVFRELVFSSGSLMEAARQAATAAGELVYFDEDGTMRNAFRYGPQVASVWTFRASEDLVSLRTTTSDENVATRVRVIGRANLGAKYLREQFIWPGKGAPAAIEYDPTTKTVWYLDYDRHLYRLDPAANMAVLEDTDLSSWLAWPDGLALDPLDGHLWVSDGYDATTGNNANRTYRKIDRGTKATLAGPFTNPDGDHCAIHAYDAGGGTVRLFMTTYTSGQLVRMNTDGTESSRVDSPKTLPTGLTSDGGGGYYLSAWEQTSLFQIAFDGTITNEIAQPAKNANELGFDSGDAGLYEVFKDENTIVKYAVAGTPESAERATLFEAVDTDLEISLGGEVRRYTLVDLGITDLAQAAAAARRLLARLSRQQVLQVVGAVGNPGLQLHDRVTIVSPGQGIASGDYLVRSIRADQTAADGTYLTVLVLEPYSADY